MSSNSETSATPAMTGAARRPRNPWVAGILGLLFGTLGQVYAGHLLRAIIWLLSLILITAVAATVALYLPNGHVAWIACAAILLGYWAAILVDAVRLARPRLPRNRWYQRWWFYLIYWLLLNAASYGMAAILRSQLADTFYVPTSSMKQTLLAGDYMLTDKLRYRLSTIQRRDVVVFWTNDHIGSVDPRFQPGRYTLVKRVVGIPGDTIEIRNEELFCNGEQVEEPYAYRSETIHASPHLARMRDMPALTLNEGEFFVLGDNRRQSLDSRLFGCIHAGDIIGPAVFVYWSRESPNIEMGAPQMDAQSPQQSGSNYVRWDRVGKRIE